jgi:hypothetical protein
VRRDVLRVLVRICAKRDVSDADDRGRVDHHAAEAAAGHRAQLAWDSDDCEGTYTEQLNWQHLRHGRGPVDPGHQHDRLWQVSLALRERCLLVDHRNAKYRAETQTRYAGDQGVSLIDVGGRDAFAYPEVGHRDAVL